jgi:hypothetical protein
MWRCVLGWMHEYKRDSPLVHSCTHLFLSSILDCLTLENWFNTLSQNTGMQLLTCAMQHPRTAQTSIITSSILLYMCMYKLVPHTKRRTDWRWSRRGCLGKHMDIRGRWYQEGGQNYAVINCITCTSHKILFRWSAQGGWDGQGMWHIQGTREVHIGIGGEIWRKETTCKIQA